MHGDDFTLLGHRGELDWFKKMIEGKFEMKHQGRMGNRDGDIKSVRLLKRIITYTEEGIEYEADQRHAEIIVKQMGLEGEAKSVITP